MGDPSKWDPHNKLANHEQEAATSRARCTAELLTASLAFVFALAFLTATAGVHIGLINSEQTVQRRNGLSDAFTRS